MQPTSTPSPYPDVRFKVLPEDFYVEELPEVQPDGEGDHLWVEVQKINLTTDDVVAALSRRLRVDPADIGVAGLKDRRAVTRQWMSLAGAQEAEVMQLDLPGVQVLQTRRHGSKLRRGQLLGNRFRVRLRGLSNDECSRLERSFLDLTATGFPNHFGFQRFGIAGGNVALGRALVTGDADGFLKAAAAPVDRESGPASEGRLALSSGDFAKALDLLPRFLAVERHLASGMLRRNPDLTATIRALPHRLRGILISAWQSASFNAVLDARLDRGLRLEVGDVVQFRGGNTCFRVEEEFFPREQERVAAGELEIAGPLPGWKLFPAAGVPGEIEAVVLATSGASALSTDLVPKKALRGTRRPMTVPVADPTTSHEEAALVLAFVLPAGSYATSLLLHLGVDVGPDRSARP
jgi:tRNA pseudouridine13 synthase